MGVSIQWSDHPPKQALAAMASLPKRLRAWFSLEADRRMHARKMMKEGLTRGGFFLMGLLLAWLWMMLIGRSVTNRCWLPGTLLQLRHRDGSHKVIDVRLSGRYNGSRLVPFNASIEAARRNRLSKPAYKSGYVSKKQRVLQEGTTASDGSSGGSRAPGKDPPARSENVGFPERRSLEAGNRPPRLDDQSHIGERPRIDRTADRKFEGHLTDEDRPYRDRMVEQRGGSDPTVGEQPDRHRTGEMRLDGQRVSEDPVLKRVPGLEGEKRTDGKPSEELLVMKKRSLQTTGEGNVAVRNKRAFEAEKLELGSNLRAESDGNGTRGSSETVALGPSSGSQLSAGTSLRTEEIITKSQGVREMVASREDGNELTLVTRPHPKTRLSNLVFGIAATAAMWSERKEILRLWWDPNRLRGYVWMDTPDLSGDNCTKGAVTARDPMAKASVLWEAHLSGALRALTNRTCGTGKKIDYSWMNKPDSGLPPVVYSANFSQYAYTHPTGLRSAIRVARVAVEMYRENHEADVLWYVMGDDDTVFNPPNLASVLSKYDPRELVYIGAPSESHLQNVEFSNEMGYGGGGFALSVALAKRLSEIFDSCLHRYPEVYGSDARVQACLAELGVHMRKERGFHQYDLLGNMAGALESHPIAPFLSMHHVAVFQPVFPRKSAMAGLAQLTRTMKRHPREFLQQTMCHNQAQKFSISIAWGYSVRWYPEFIRPTDLERPQRTFRAWNRGREPFDFDMDTRNTPVTICRLPSLFHSSGASSRMEDGRLMLETRYTRTVTEWAEEGSLEDGSVRSSSKLRKVSKACPEGEVHIPQREVTEVRVIAPPLSDGWVLAPRRQCCQSVEVVDEKTVEIKLDVCGEGQLIG